MDEAQAGDLVARVEGLLEEVEALGDPAARAKATEIAAALLDLYGEGLARIVERIAERDDGELAEALSGDELVSHLLLLHGLHPVPVEARVLEALGEVRPYLESHGGDVELLSVEGGVAHLRLEGSCSGCPSSTMTLKLAIENAIRKLAPEIEEIDAEGAAATPASGLIQLEVNGSAAADAKAPGPDGEAAWTMAGGMPELAAGDGTTPLVKEVTGEKLLFVGIGDQIYAYRPGCPQCGDPLAEAVVERTELACPGCGNRYDALRAGRCLDSPQLHLEPVPLLVDESGLVKVALGAAV